MFIKSVRLGFILCGLTILMSGVSFADLKDMSHLEDDSDVVAASIGYRWADEDGNADRAAEYTYLDDSPFFALSAEKNSAENYFSLIGEYNNENEYTLMGQFDYKTLLRLGARTERIYHNLDHLPYEGPESRAPAVGLTAYSDNDPDAVYGRRVTFDEVKVRGKLPHYPAHVNLEVWRMEKKGKEQLRFVDEGCTTSCHMQSDTREINRITEEIKAGFDAHLGPVDIAFLQTLREFREKEETPENDFDSHTLGRPAGSYLHDQAPDSKVSESTFMINLPPSGGFVTSASYTLGKRENESDLTTHTPIDAETDYQKLAADVTYTPGEKWTVNFRYRMLDLDSDVPATLTANDGQTYGFVWGDTVPVRQSIDIDRNNYAAYISYRPTYRLSIKGEYEREDVDRSNTGLGSHDTFAGIDNPNWDVSSNETTDRIRVTVLSRHLEKSALKFNGWYEHVNTDNPAYGTTLSESDEIFFSASYKPSSVWGTTGSIDILRGKNDERTVIQFDGATQVPYDIDREEKSEKLALGIWYIPNDIFSADMNYGFLHSKVDQDVLFGNTPNSADPGSATDFTTLDDGADYEQSVHTISVGVNVRIGEKTNCRLEGYHIRSHADFTPAFDPRSLDYLSGTALATADELKEISEVDIRQKGLKARIRWQLNDMLAAGMEYTFDDYDDRNSSIFDGTAQTIMASLTGVF